MLSVILVLVFVGLILYLINRFAPLDAKIKTIINWFVVICVVIWLLNIFGVFHYLNVPVPKL